MIEIQVKTNLPELRSSLRKLTTELGGTAIVRALNKTAAQAKVVASREVRAAGYNIKAAAIKQSIDIRPARRNDLRATLVATGRPIPLLAYAARQTAAGLSVSVKNGRKIIPGAFIATMRSGHEGAFARLLGTQTGKRGQPILNRKIKELWGPSVPTALLNAKVRAAMEGAIRERFPRVLEQEVRFVLLKARK